jgi:hypothetical protein
MASQAAPPDGDYKKPNTTESVVFSPSASSNGDPESRDGGDVRPADYDSETVEKVYRYGALPHLQSYTEYSSTNSDSLPEKLISELSLVSINHVQAQSLEDSS